MPFLIGRNRPHLFGFPIFKKMRKLRTFILSKKLPTYIFNNAGNALLFLLRTVHSESAQLQIRNIRDLFTIILLGVLYLTSATK